MPATYLGVANGAGSHGHVLQKTWQGMIQRCYGRDDIGFADYGGRGVHVCDRWLEFKSFAEDAEKLPGWELKKSRPRSYVLDKDGRGDGFRYSPETCQWVTPAENGSLRSDRVYTVRRIADGKSFSFTNPTSFCRSMGLEDRNFSDLWTKRKNAKRREGFELVSIEEQNAGLDQIANVIAGIQAVKADATASVGRRLIVSAWNPVDVPKMALPPCHTLFQFSVTDGRLSCQLYQRSGDAFLGCPYNLASYALLTHLIAQATGLEVGEFVHSFGDVHIYENHLEQVHEQLRRQPLPLPRLHLHPGIFFDGKAFSVRDPLFAVDKPLDASYIELQGYRHHPALRGEVAI